MILGSLGYSLRPMARAKQMLSVNPEVNLSKAVYMHGKPPGWLANAARRWTVPQVHRALRVLAGKYARVIRRGLRAARPLPAGELRGVRHDVRFTRRPWTPAFVRRRIRELEQVFAAPGVTDLPHLGQPPLQTRGLDMVRLQGFRALLAGYRGGRPPNPPVSVHGLRIGPVALLGVGLEVFHSLQAPILRGSPHPHTWVVSLAGGVGYAPDARACAQQGYTDDLVPLIVGERPYTRVYTELPRALVRLAQELA